MLSSESSDCLSCICLLWIISKVFPHLCWIEIYGKIVHKSASYTKIWAYEAVSMTNACLQCDMLWWLSEMLTANVYPLQLFLEHLLLLWSLGVYLLSWCWLALLDATMFASCDNLHSRFMKLESRALFLMHLSSLLTSSANCALIPHLNLAPISASMCIFVILFHADAACTQDSPLPIQQQKLINI